MCDFCTPLGNAANTNNVKTLSSLNLESTLRKVSKQTTSEYKASSVGSQPDGSLSNCNKAYSSTLSLDPLSSTSGSSHRLDAYSTSMPSLDPLSLGSPRTDAFRSALPRADPISFSMPRLDPLSINQTTLPYEPPSPGPFQLNSHVPSLWPNHHAADHGPAAEPSTVPVSIPAAPAEPLTSCLKPWSDQPSAPDPEAQTALSSDTSGAMSLAPKAESAARPPEPKCTIPLPDPPASCLKSRPEGVLVNHREPRSTSRVGLRVHFKLPEDEEKEESEDGSSGHEDMYLAPKEPPPVLAKPKL